MIFKIHASMTYRSSKKNHLVNVDLRVCRLSYVWMTETLRFVRVPRVTIFHLASFETLNTLILVQTLKLRLRCTFEPLSRRKSGSKPIGYETFHLADVRITLTKMITHRYAWRFVARADSQPYTNDDSVSLKNNDNVVHRAFPPVPA